jgi:biopolymer transport protein ExbD
VGVIEKSSKKSRDYTMELHLTSMVDMMTILLVFLLKSYSVDQTNIIVSKDLKLPQSTETRLIDNILNVVVTTKEIMVDGTNVVNLYKRQITNSDLGPDGVIIKPLLRRLIRTKKLQQESVKILSRDKVILQADKSLKYSLIKKVLYTAGEAGYPKFKFLVLKKEE